jgi:hypothetical protein
MKYILGSVIVILIIALTVWFMTTKKQKDGFSMVSMDAKGDLSIDTFILGDDGGVSEIKPSNGGLTIPGTLNVTGDLTTSGKLTTSDATVNGSVTVPSNKKFCIDSNCIDGNAISFLKNTMTL